MNNCLENKNLLRGTKVRFKYPVNNIFVESTGYIDNRHARSDGSLDYRIFSETGVKVVPAEWVIEVLEDLSERVLEDKLLMENEKIRKALLSAGIITKESQYEGLLSYDYKGATVLYNKSTCECCHCSRKIVVPIKVLQGKGTPLIAWLKNEVVSIENKE